MGAELSVKPSDLSNTSDAEPTTKEKNKLTNYNKGDIVTCYITVLNNYEILVVVNPSIRGKIPLLLSSDDLKDLKKLKNKFKPGQALKAEVVEVDEKHNRLVLSRTGETSQVIKKHSILVGRILKI